MPTPAETRAHAATLLNRIIDREETTDQVLNSTDKNPLLQELLYGSLRYYFSLSQAADRALRNPLRAKDHDIRCLLIVGLYQLHHTRTPPHAALHETVEAARHLGKPWAKALVNAVLRNAPAPERSFEHPAWMERSLKQAYGDLAPAIMLANNERAPMALRINLDRIEPAGYRNTLKAAGIGFRELSAETTDGVYGWGPETLVLEQPLPAQRLPGYTDGLVSIQDAGAQLAASILTHSLGVAQKADPSNPAPERVLDACAAPGGKLFHLLERNRTIEVVALDSSRARLETLKKEAERLGHRRFAAIVGDATGLDWWDGVPFDHLLIDAPCSGSGTLRRHPDIKLLRHASDLKRYAALQRDLLQTLWQTLRPGGTLLYCTCSLFPTENDDVISHFLDQQADASPSPFRLSTGQPTIFGWQLLPTDTETDGFYFSLLRKAPE